jgi:hypothetical protein
MFIERKLCALCSNSSLFEQLVHDVLVYITYKLILVLQFVRHFPPVQSPSCCWWLVLARTGSRILLNAQFQWPEAAALWRLSSS